MKNYRIVLHIALLFVALAACRHDDEIFIPERVEVSKPEYSAVAGFYLLNEGNMGSNKCTLDRYDYSTGIYTRNIYGSANPSVPKELGDVGNDLAIYGSRLYAVVNCSNKIEVMDAASCVRIGQIDIPNCRYIRFHEGFAYVTSYAGPVVIDPEYEQLGFVAKIDTLTLREVARCTVGFQPDGLEIVDDKIYVANSGGYRVPNYECRLSVINLPSMTVEEEVDIDINLQHVQCDRYGGLWISSRGDYVESTSKLFCYDVRKRRIVAEIDVPVSNMVLQGDSLYIVSNAWSNVTMTDEPSYSIVDVVQKRVVCDNFITDGTDEAIRKPYGIAVNPVTKDILVTDARNYVNPGYLYCFGSDGVMRWSVRTGDIPAHIFFF
ncbi:MAG: YncE family protein [Bacteroidales bacterium]|nr:YncE family protein [Bacteroidales bacterium]